MVFSVEEGVLVLRPLAFFVIGVVIYAIFVFKFYRFVAKKDVFSLNLSQYNTLRFGLLRKTLHVILYILEYLLLFPLLSFFWFVVLTLLLTFLSRTGSAETILLISMALVSAVRATAYYDEDLSKDLAKMLPFALLGVFLVDITYFSIDQSIMTLLAIPSEYVVLTYYLIFAVGLEFILRLLSLFIALFRRSKDA